MEAIVTPALGRGIKEPWFICALSAAGASFLILEMDRPFDGWVGISSAPLRKALAHIGQ